METLDSSAWDLLFLEARTHSVWQTKPVDDALLRRLYEIVRMAPTSANGQPMRLLFVKSPDAKQRLRPLLDAGNVDKTLSAPVTAIVAYDTQFYEHMSKLVPHRPEMGKAFGGFPEEVRKRIGTLSGTLQGGYLILAARGLGLDCGPMGGFNANGVDAEFFPDGRYKTLFLLNLGYGDASKLHPRAPRLAFDEACQIL